MFGIIFTLAEFEGFIEGVYDECIDFNTQTLR